MTDDPFLERLQKAADARKRIDKLMALAHKHPDTEEGKSALRKAGLLARKAGIEITGGVPLTKPPKYLNPGAMSAFAGAIKKTFPGKIDASDLEKPNYRTVDKEEDLDDDTY